MKRKQTCFPLQRFSLSSEFTDLPLPSNVIELALGWGPVLTSMTSPYPHQKQRHPEGCEDDLPGVTHIKWTSKSNLLDSLWTQADLCSYFSRRVLSNQVCFQKLHDEHSFSTSWHWVRGLGWLFPYVLCAESRQTRLLWVTDPTKDLNESCPGHLWGYRQLTETAL